MREWSMRLYLLDEEGNEHPGDVFTKVVYNLHPTFENPTQSKSRSAVILLPGSYNGCFAVLTLVLPAFIKPPFVCSNEGWGEFEISIDCYTTEKTKCQPIIQDLNFQENRYEVTHPITFKNPSQALQERLRETGPLPTDEDRSAKKKGGLGGGGGGGVALGKKSSQKFDYEKIAEALEKLEEEDLLRVIQMINENKSPDTYIRSDVEGESSFPLGDGRTFLPPPPPPIRSARVAFPLC